MPFSNNISLARDFIFDLIFPIECLGCGEQGKWLCGQCFKKLEVNSKQRCLNCKTENDFGGLCPECKKNFYLDGVLAAGNYEDKLISQLIKQYKYYFSLKVADILSDFVLFFLRNLNSQIILLPAKRTGAPRFLFKQNNYCIMPVPLHKRRLRWRGFNQSEKLAKILSKKLNIPLINNQLIRTKYNRPQAKINSQKRKNNISGCFQYQGDSLAKKNIILIDDVVTSGSTLDECAKILKEKGAQKVWGLCVARGG
ncbi:ComF family protein [Candidatus Parcubacteria bacterium]|nr:ComF family protein [Candidatus Parcubacteria bacterium]